MRSWRHLLGFVFVKPSVTLCRLTRRDDAHPGVIGAGGLVRMRHREQCAVRIVPERKPAFLGLAMGRIKNRERQRIQKHRRRPFERDPVLRHVGKRFSGVPLKIIDDLCAHAAYCSASHDGLANSSTHLITYWPVCILTGQQETFNWKSVAVSAIAAPLTPKINQAFGAPDTTALGLDDATRISRAYTGQAFSWTGLGNRLGAELTQSTTRQLIGIALNREGRVDWTQVAADGFGNALGNTVVDSVKHSAATRKWEAEQAQVEAQREVARMFDPLPPEIPVAQPDGSLLWPSGAISRGIPPQEFIVGQRLEESPEMRAQREATQFRIQAMMAAQDDPPGQPGGVGPDDLLLIGIPSVLKGIGALSTRLFAAEGGTVGVRGGVSVGGETSIAGVGNSTRTADLLFENPSALVQGRVGTLNAAIPENSRGFITMGVGVAEDTAGARSVLISTSEPRGYLRPGVELNPGEILVRGTGHAEVDIVTHVNANNLKLIDIGDTRPVCPTCQTTILPTGANISTPLKYPR